MMALPSALRPLTEAPRWVGWRWTVRNGKQDKPLFRAYSPTQFASTADPMTWAPFRAAVEALQAKRVDGIGYVVRDDIERVFADLDKCRDPETGEIADWAMRFVECCNSYTEITPSGCGLRVIGLPGCISAPIHTAYKLPGGGQGEIFFRAVRYVTVTGNRLPGTPDELRDISDPVLDLLASAGRVKETGERHTSNDDPSASPEDIAAALAQIPNDNVPWDEWVRVGMAAWRASGGAETGREAWREWSAKSPKHDDREVDDRWAHFRRSPPSRIGYGTLLYMARNSNGLFVPPSWRGEPQPRQERVDPETGEVFEEAPQTKKARTIRILSLGEVEALQPPKWLIDGLLPEQSIAVPYGPPKVGKTFVVLSQALHIAAGMEWMGRAVTRGAVVYVAGEGVGGLSLRIRGMRAHYGIPADIPFWVIPRAVNFRDAKAVAELMAVIRETVGEIPLALTVLDTLARAMPGVDENSAEEVGLVIAACDTVKQELGCAVMAVHHAGKDIERGLRGSSAIHGALDVSFVIKGTEDGRVQMINEDQKDAEPAPPMMFRMETVAAGIGRTTLVPVLDAEPAPAKDKRPLPSGARAGLAALKEALTKEGAPVSMRDLPANVPMVSLEAWRREFHARSTLENYQARKKAFQRATKELLDARVAMVLHDRAWLINGDAEQGT